MRTPNVGIESSPGRRIGLGRPPVRPPFARLVALLLTWILLPELPALAHRLSSSSLRLAPSVAGSHWQGRITVPLRDLAMLTRLDRNGDQAVTWGELQAADESLQEILRLHLVLTSDESTWDLVIEPVEVDTLAGEPCASWAFSTPPRASVSESPLEVRYTLLFAIDPDHRCLVRCATGSATEPTATAVLSPEQTTARFSASSATSSTISTSFPLSGFFAEGVHHIWIGYDHILFLLALLLPAVVLQGNAGAERVSRFPAVALEVARVVTAFTVAHSITLGLAAFDVVRVPSRWVETLIAASVAIAALNNLVPFFRDRSWRIAFGFGLIHGFGFAGVLADLDLPRNEFARGLIGFNVGVEAGQLALVAVFLPIAYLLRQSWVYRRLAVHGGSLAIVGVAGFWTAQRAFYG
ncbi:MAG: HupE/UreJ family protein [Limisphaerales bacterium]